MMKNYLPIVEKFHSLQGEGFHSGKSAFFIRLAGCKVGCPWCDTKQSWDIKKHPLISINTLLQEIQTARYQGASFIVITGGEPLHHNLDNLCNIIKKNTYSETQKPIEIHLETSGVNNISGKYDWITLSPKRHNPPKNYFLQKCNEIKVVINDKNDIEFANQVRKKILNLKEIDLHTKKFYVQPAWKSLKGISLAIDFVKTHPYWTLSLQTHKYLNLQ